MYICFDCHCEFDEPEMKYGFGGYPEEPTWHCPYCGSTDYDEAEESAENWPEVGSDDLPF